MVFNLFSGGTKEKPEYVPDEILTEAMQLIVTAMESQISNARDMAQAMPDGDARFNALLSGSFFFGYVVGLSDRIGLDRFGELIDKQNHVKNIRRLLQGVVANIFYPNTEPDWDGVLAWEAQAAAFGTTQNDSYVDGMRVGALFGDEVLTGTNTPSITLLGSELLKPL